MSNKFFFTLKTITFNFIKNQTTSNSIFYTFSFIFFDDIIFFTFLTLQYLSIIIIKFTLWNDLIT